MRRLLLPLIIALALLSPAVASAADWFPIVPCGTSAAGRLPCTPCDLFKTFKNVIDLVLYGITGPIAAFMIVWAGGIMLISGDNPARFKQGTDLLRNTLIGVTIILAAWLFTNTLIKSLATGSQFDAWYEFSCPAFLQQAEAAPLPAPVPAKGSPDKPAPELAAAAAATRKEENLATANKVPVHQVSEYRASPNNSALNSPSLNTLISCINRDPVISALYDRAQLFTYEVSNPRCNLTRGVEDVVGNCQHAEFSCHYGGHAGTQGAMGVDYNYRGIRVTYLVASRTIVSAASAACRTKPSDCRTVSSEEGLFDELYRALEKNNCDYKWINFERDHTHIGTADCDSQGTGVGKLRTAPSIP